MYAGDEVYGDDVTSGLDPEDCAHDEVDPDLGFAGDPAREYPDGRGTCRACGEYVEPGDDRDEDERYGSLSHEAWLIEMERFD